MDTKKFANETNSATYLLLKLLILFPDLKIKIKKAPTTGSKIKDDRIG